MVKDHDGHEDHDNETVDERTTDNDETADERTMDNDRGRYGDHNQVKMEAKKDCYEGTAMKQEKENQRRREERQIQNNQLKHRLFSCFVYKDSPTSTHRPCCVTRYIRCYRFSWPDQVPRQDPRSGTCNVEEQE